jgi:hypothetical protein
MVYKQAWSIKNYRYVWNISYVPEHAPTTVRASGCRRIAPSGYIVTDFGPRRRLPTFLLRHVLAGGSHTTALTRALQPRRPIGP